ncbi:hypothetical protein HGRIS_011615 [Hohenbuehelia grisea]|uniref:LIM zinc-binding domain-containing protein n=1 Tax=Hohenbuehelia grisea TaxID=104357 RepID=A0ABR3JXW0_9AGAR
MSYYSQQPYQQPQNIYQQLHLNQPPAGYQIYQQQTQPYPQQPQPPQQHPQHPQHPVPGQFYQNQPPSQPYHQQAQQPYPAPTPVPSQTPAPGFQYAQPRYATPHQQPQPQRQGTGYVPTHSYAQSVPSIHPYAPPPGSYAATHHQQYPPQYASNVTASPIPPPSAQDNRPLPPPRRGETLPSLNPGVNGNIPPTSAFAQLRSRGHAPSASFSSPSTTSTSTFASAQPPQLGRAQSVAVHAPSARQYAPPVAPSASLPGSTPSQLPPHFASSALGGYSQAANSPSPLHSSPSRSSPTRRPLPAPSAGSRIVNDEASTSPDASRPSKHHSMPAFGISSGQSSDNNAAFAVTGQAVRSPSPVKSFQQGFSHPRDWSQDSDTTDIPGRRSPTKRRASPPRFNPQGDDGTTDFDRSTGIKLVSPSSGSFSFNEQESNPSPVTPSSASTSSLNSSDPTASSDTPPTSPTKKFVPLWKRALGVGKLSRSNSKSADKATLKSSEEIGEAPSVGPSELGRESTDGPEANASASEPRASGMRRPLPKPAGQTGSQIQSTAKPSWVQSPSAFPLQQTHPDPQSRISQHQQPYTSPPTSHAPPTPSRTNSSFHRRESARDGSVSPVRPSGTLTTVGEEEHNSSVEYDATDAYSGIFKTGTSSADSSMSSSAKRLAGSADEEDEDSDEEESHLAYDESMHSTSTADDDSSSVPPAPSPQYGIRDLPNVRQSAFAPPVTSSPVRPQVTSQPQPPSQPQIMPNQSRTTSGHTWGSSNGSGSTASGSGLGRQTSMSRGLPRPPAMDRGGSSPGQTPVSANVTSRQGQFGGQGNNAGSSQSMTLRFAAMGLNSGATGTNGSRTSESSNGQWPAGVPQLPRAPVVGTRSTGSSGFSNSSAYTPTSTSSRGPSSQPGSRGRSDMINLDDAPPVGLRGRTPSPARGQSGARYSSPEKSQSRPLPQVQPRSQPSMPNYYGRTPAPPPSALPPRINIESPAPMGGRARTADIPRIEFNSEGDIDDNQPGAGPAINVSAPMISISGVGDDDDDDDVPGGGPQINVSGPGDDDDDSGGGFQINVSGPDDAENPSPATRSPAKRPLPPIYRGALVCAGCGKALVGRIVSAMGLRWHPNCFKCTVCSELLEHVSSFEHEGRPYCHLDYHENFAPRCYSCKTAIIEERFISLDDPALGLRTYHEQHFFCAECGDPFITPTTARRRQAGGELELNVNGDGQFVLDDDVGFTVYKGHPYCEACHVRLRMPKCKKCKKSIRDGMQAVEALGSKWCWGCFVCAGCDRPFDDPSFFQHEGLPFCERCFSIILRNNI